MGNPGYSQPAPAPVRRVAWEDLSTSALNYRDSSRSRSLPHFGAYNDGYGGGYSSLPRSQRPHSSLAEYRGFANDPSSRRSHSSLGEYRPQSSRYRDHGGVDYGIDYGDNYPGYGGHAGGYGGGGGGGGGGLGGGYHGLSS